MLLETAMVFDRRADACECLDYTVMVLADLEDHGECLVTVTGVIQLLLQCGAA